MRRALIIAPNWPPLSFPDMHRVRMALPYFRGCGWEPLILKIDPDEQWGTRDPDLVASVPADTRVWMAGCIPRRWTKWFGLNHVGIRSFLHIARLGNALIRSEAPQVVFFSTTMFPLFILGRYWHWRHAIPYVLDFQDPWSAGTYPTRSRTSWKDRLAMALARLLEPYAVKGAAQIICVSPDYREALIQSYGLDPTRISVLPFGGPQCDFDLLGRMDVHPAFDPTDGHEHWVYAGRGGDDMAFALRGLFTALRVARDRDPRRYANVRLHFLGTDYASGDRARKTVVPIAEACGVGDQVMETPQRIPYFQALKSLQAADSLIMPGSFDPAYTASKVYPYILARRPLLAVFHQKSSVVEVIRSTRAGTVVTFGSSDSAEQLAAKIDEEWFRAITDSRDETDWKAFESYGAGEMTRKLCHLFEISASADRPWPVQ